MNTKNIDELLHSLENRKNALDEFLSSRGVNLTSGGEEASVFKTDCAELKKLRVAAIADDFTLGNFKPECELFELDESCWKSQIDEFSPDMLFIESAWNGKNKSWYKKIANGSRSLYELTSYCRSKGVPVVFWNKEDPVWTDVFMAAASCADFVFTTDFDCIDRYKRTLRHDNVYFLPFGAQPQVHNPLEMHDRKDKFCFAGAYYHRYKERSKVFDDFAQTLERGKGLEIFDRNLGSARPEHAFPQRYSKMIVGTLTPEDIHIAYKGYNYGINMNSVSSSQTMFARRVFELLASNTVCVGNYSRGVKNLLGELTVCTDSAQTMQAQLEKYCADEESYRKYRLLGLRKTLSAHLCEDRLGFIASCVFGKSMKRKPPEILVTADNITDGVRRAFERQSYENKRLVDKSELSAARDGAFVALFDESCYYAENYLFDLALSVRYSSKKGFGKLCVYEKTPDGFILGDRSVTYKPCGSLLPSQSIILKSEIKDIGSFISDRELEGDFLCTDEFSFCRGFCGECCPKVDDLRVPDTGIPLKVINEAAAATHYEQLGEELFRLTPNQMSECAVSRARGVKTFNQGSRLVVSSSLADKKTAYLDLSRKLGLNDIGVSGSLSVMLSCGGELDAMTCCSFFDGGGRLISSQNAAAGKMSTCDVPSGAESVKLSLRICGSGEKELSAALLGGERVGAYPRFLSRSRLCVVADHYPDYADLYRYMFVHKRVRLYSEYGANADVLCINMYNKDSYREFEGVNVTSGSASRLAAILENSDVKTLFVHFMNEYLWSVIKNYLDEIRLVIWSHGSDIQPWHRRKYNLKTEKEKSEAIAASEKRERLWREIFERAKTADIKFVFVSEFFKKQVEEDYGVSLGDRAQVIHNCIDSRLFSYEEKPPEQRFAVMSVKSFSTLTYANDITQQAILELSREKEFGSITIDLYGDGERFEQDTKLLARFKNVRLHRGFLPQSEIAKLHKSHGIYIATTRMDTQGVSRDEAMSSGLVPIATNVAAIPEFVDSSCGILTPPEDASAVAQAILSLVRDENKFTSLSRAAAERVRLLSSRDATVKAELLLARTEDFKW